MTAVFSGFNKETLPFLKALGFHQNREWFHENKHIYERAVKTPMGDLVEDVTDRFGAARIPLKGNRKTSLYRVNRDVRFSKNKDPYVTHGSFMLTRSGDKKENGFVYMHFSNERVFIASGFYNLVGDEMRAFRELIIREKAKMTKLVTDMESHGYRFDLSEILKRNPRGFESIEGEPMQSWVRLKNYTFIEELTGADLFEPGLADKLFLLGQRSLGFLEFGWRAIDSVRVQNDV
jgi:uncharacterized protein (TIGR02453 family)